MSSIWKFVNQQHVLNNDGGQTLYKTRLSVCDNFKNISLADRADLIMKANGCVLCQNWAQDHC